MMNKRHLAPCRQGNARPVRVETLEDRSLPSGFASSTFLPAPAVVPPVQDLTRQATGLALGVVSQGTGRVLAPAGQSTGSAVGLITTQVSGRSLPEGGAALGRGADITPW